MITVLNIICFSLLTLLFTKTVAVWFLLFFKYNSIADRLRMVNSDDPEGMHVAKLFVKFFMFIGYGADVVALYTGEYSTMYSDRLNISSIMVVTIVGGITVMTLLGALLHWHENMAEK